MIANPVLNTTLQTIATGFGAGSVALIAKGDYLMATLCAVVCVAVYAAYELLP